MVEQANQVEDVEVVSGDVITSEEEAKIKVEEIMKQLNNSMQFQKLEILQGEEQIAANHNQKRNFYYEVTDPDQFMAAYSELEELAKDVPIAQAAYQRIQWEGDPQMGKEAFKEKIVPSEKEPTILHTEEINHFMEPEQGDEKLSYSDTIEKQFKESLANMTNLDQKETSPHQDEKEEKPILQQEVNKEEESKDDLNLEKDPEEKEVNPYEIFSIQELRKDILTLNQEIEQVEMELKILQEDISNLPEEGSELQKQQMEMKLQELGFQRDSLKQNVTDKKQILEALFPEATLVQEKPEIEPKTQEDRTEQMAFEPNNENASLSYSPKEDTTALVPAKKHNKLVQFFIRMKDKILGKEKISSAPATKVRNEYHENASQNMREELKGNTRSFQEIGEESLDFNENIPRREREERSNSR